MQKGGAFAYLASPVLELIKCYISDKWWPVQDREEVSQPGPRPVVELRRPPRVQKMMSNCAKSGAAWGTIFTGAHADRGHSHEITLTVT